MTVTLETVKQALADRYAVERQLDHGAMSVVFCARSHATGASVAVKVLRPEFAATLIGNRFQREIAILSELQHPNILPLLESDRLGDLVFFTMPYAPDSLRRRLQRDTRLGLQDALAITRAVAAGLDYAHAQHVVHRDIKPENVLFDPTHRAMISDFGVARALVKAGGERLSTSGLVVGTPSYMSPEQASGRDLDSRSDIYALACVVFEMLAAEPPFTGRNPQTIMARHAKERPPSVRVVRPDVPQHVDDALRRALAKEPDQRPQSGGELTSLLAA